jgi:hypothetical protein
VHGALCLCCRHRSLLPSGAFVVLFGAFMIIGLLIHLAMVVTWPGLTTGRGLLISGLLRKRPRFRGRCRGHKTRILREFFHPSIPPGLPRMPRMLHATMLAGHFNSSSQIATDRLGKLLEQDIATAGPFLVHKAGNFFIFLRSELIPRLGGRQRTPDRAGFPDRPADQVVNLVQDLAPADTLGDELPAEKAGIPRTVGGVTSDQKVRPPFHRNHCTAIALLRRLVGRTTNHVRGQDTYFYLLFE